MNKIIYVIFFMTFLLFSNSYSQLFRVEPADAVISMGLAQSTIKDWKQGEVTGIEFSSSLDLKSNFRIDTMKLRLNFKYAAGMQYLKDDKNIYEVFIPTDNMMSGESVLVYPLGWKLDPFISASFNTQITESFIIVKGEKVRTASLWDPVTSQETCGFEYSFIDTTLNFLSRIGLSYKQIRAELYTKLTDDYKTRDIVERYKVQTGIQWKTESNFKINESIIYKATLDSFSSFEDMQKWSFLFSNQFQFKVFKSVAIVMNLNFAYDEVQMTELQYRQNLRFGIVINPK